MRRQFRFFPLQFQLRNNSDLNENPTLLLFLIFSFHLIPANFFDRQRKRGSTNADGNIWKYLLIDVVKVMNYNA